MADTIKLNELISAVDALSPAEQDAFLRRVQRRPVAMAPTVTVTNQGKSEVLIDEGAAPKSLGGGEKFECDIPTVPSARGTGTPLTPDASGLPSGPKSLLSLRLSGSEKKGGEVRIDLGGWTTHAARCGWPFALVRQAEKRGPGRWRLEARTAFDLELPKAGTVDLVVIGLGVDLSDLAERFAIMFETGSTDDESKEDAK